MLEVAGEKKFCSVYVLSDAEVKINSFNYELLSSVDFSLCLFIFS